MEQCPWILCRGNSAFVDRCKEIDIPLRNQGPGLKDILHKGSYRSLIECIFPSQFTREHYGDSVLILLFPLLLQQQLQIVLLLSPSPSLSMCFFCTLCFQELSMYSVYELSAFRWIGCLSLTPFVSGFVACRVYLCWQYGFVLRL